MMFPDELDTLIANVQPVAEAPNGTHKLLRGKKIVLYGAGDGLVTFVTFVLSRYELKAEVVLDTKFKSPTTLFDIPACSPLDFAPTQELQKDGIAIITVGRRDYHSEILATLKRLGFCTIIYAWDVYEYHLPSVTQERREFERDYYARNREQILSAYTLLADEQSKEVFAAFLRTHLTRLRMAEYRKVAEKLVREIPFLYLIDVYIWGEPFLNPDLASIIKINTELGVATGISSNLNIRKNLEEVVKAAPAQLRISLSGFGSEHYEQTHTGGNWESVLTNLSNVAAYIRKYETGTLVELYYHINKNNIAEAKRVRALCDELGFRFHASISMLFHDYALDFLDGNTLCEEAQRAKAIMTVSLEEMLETASSQREKPCLLKRVMPVINWDLSVLPCCNYSSNKIAGALVAKNYLETPLAELLRQRERNPLCIKCQNLALHRYFNPVYYTDYINALIAKDL